ncbi:Ankyrin repeat domain-containing protein 29 [Araneus ventricosus]|uniref:Ankyrin repeat domain-containing protein 29 n=1 Tax=Araneus ventricosus TaxID=182803 RepID=A0A4Y2KH96_ARAVE|nr:Ankyrin repeat domain-containing protein 29 [Araneus ventricosus]
MIFPELLCNNNISRALEYGLTMFKSSDSVPKNLVFDTTFQGLAGQSYTFFNNDETSPPSKEMLHRSALRGDLRLLKRVLDAGIPVDVTDGEEKTTALILACRYNHYACAKVLLEYGANPSARRQSGLHSLCYAAQGGFLPIVKLLIEYGVDVELPGADGATSFLLACRCNHVDVTQELLNAKPDYAKRVVESALPMYIAAQHGHVPIIQFLISRGADVNVQRRVPSTSNSAPPSLNGSTALFVACQFGHTSLVKKLVEWGADVNLTRDDGCSPLLKAAQKGFSNIVKFLLSKGAHHGVLRNGETPLHAAAYYGHINVLKALVEAGADVNLKNRRGITALGKADEGGQQIAIRYLTRIQSEKSATESNSS